MMPGSRMSIRYINVDPGSMGISPRSSETSGRLRLLLLLHFSLLIASLLQPAASAAPPLDDESKQLAFCGGVLAYAANWFLLQDNEGAAKSMLFQHARAKVALISKHYENGRISGERVAAFDREEQIAKPFLDQNPGKLGEVVDVCVAVTSRAVGRESQRKMKLWDKDFYQLVEELAAKSRSMLGLR